MLNSFAPICQSSHVNVLLLFSQLYALLTESIELFTIHVMVSFVPGVTGLKAEGLLGSVFVGADSPTAVNFNSCLFTCLLLTFISFQM